MLDRVVLIGYYGKGNIGDDAILMQFLDEYHRINPMGHAVVLTHDTVDTSTRFNCSAVYIKDIKAVMKEVRKSKALIFGGGGQTLDRTDALLFSFFLVLFTKLTRGKVMTYAIGVEKPHKTFNKVLAKHMYNFLIDMIIVRDEESHNFLRDIGVTKDISITADPVYGLKPNSEESVAVQAVHQTLKEFKDDHPLLAMNFVYANDNPKYQKIKIYYGEIVQYCINKGYKVLLISMSPKEGDIDLINKIMAEVNSKDDVYVLTDIKDPKELINLLQEADAVIAMRFHLLIFGVIQGKPLASIVRSPKVKSLMKSLEQSILCDINDFTLDQILTNIDQFMVNQEGYRESCLTNRKKIIERQKNNRLLYHEFLIRER